MKAQNIFTLLQKLKCVLILTKLITDPHETRSRFRIESDQVFA